MNNVQTTPAKGNFSSNHSSSKEKYTLHKFAEITIETNNKDIPYISIYKPHPQEQHKRVSSAVKIEKIINKSQLLKLYYGFYKLKQLKHMEKHTQEKISKLHQIYLKLRRGKIMSGFFKLVAHNMQKKRGLLGIKILFAFQKKFIIKTTKQCFRALMLNRYQVIIKSINPTDTALELCALKTTLLSESFINKLKQFQKYIPHQQFLDQLGQANFKNVINLQRKRLQGLRMKTGNRKDLFDSQLVLLVLGKAIQTIEKCLTNCKLGEGQIEQLRNNIIEFKEEILKHQIKMQSIQACITSLSHMDADIKKIITNKSHRQMTAMIATQIQNMQQSQNQSQNSTVRQILNSRLLWNSIVIDMLKQAYDEEYINSQISQLVLISTDQHKLMDFVGEIQEDSTIRVLASTILKFYHKMSQLQSQITTYKQHSFIKNKSLSGISNIKYKSEKSFHFERKPSQKQANSFKMEDKQGSLINKFFSSLREFLQSYQFDEQLMKSILKCEYLFETMIKGYEQEKDRAIQQNQVLKGENEQLMKFKKDYESLLSANSHLIEQIKKIMAANQQSNLAVNRLSSQNSQLIKQVSHLKQSNVSVIERQRCSSNEGSLLREKSLIQSKMAMKQNDLMREIMRLKIECQSLKVKHQREKSSLINHISWYENKIGELQIQIYSFNIQLSKHHADTLKSQINLSPSSNYQENKLPHPQQQSNSRVYASVPLSQGFKAESLDKQSLIFRSSESLVYSLDEGKEEIVITVGLNPSS